MAITGISSYDGKQIIAAGSQSATKAYQDSNGGVITSKYQTTAGMSNYATTASVTGKQDALTFGYIDDQISQINGSGIYSQGGGGGGVVTATGGTTTYVQTINGKNISATNAGSALSATDAYNLINTAIKVASATSASTAYTLGNTAIKVASATSASNANTATYASNGVSLTNIYNSARSGYAASAYCNAMSNNVKVYDQLSSFSNANNNSLGLYMNTANFLTSHNGTTLRAIFAPVNEGLYRVTVSLQVTPNFSFKGTWAAYSFLSAAKGGHFVAPYTAQIGNAWNHAVGGVECGGNYVTNVNINVWGTAAQTAGVVIYYDGFYAFW